jgi:hypothetical protein
MEPHLANNDKIMFYNYLDKATFYFEYGSGGSTYQASIRNNITQIYSVESDIQWQKKLKATITKPNITYILNDLDTIPNKWGYPGPKCTPQQMINYSHHIKYLSPEEQQKIDFILIDGRFRVACCLKCFDVINNDCLIAFDDFLDRPQYHVVLNYYDIIDKTIDYRMVILKKKNGIQNSPDDLIKKYELEKF